MLNKVAAVLLILPGVVALLEFVGVLHAFGHVIEKMLGVVIK